MFYAVPAAMAVTATVRPAWSYWLLTSELFIIAFFPCAKNQNGNVWFIDDVILLEAFQKQHYTVNVFGCVLLNAVSCLHKTADAQPGAKCWMKHKAGSNIKLSQPTREQHWKKFKINKAGCKQRDHLSSYILEKFAETAANENKQI